MIFGFDKNEVFLIEGGEVWYFRFGYYCFNVIMENWKYIVGVILF